MNYFEEEYKELLRKILSYGSKEQNRTGVDCYTLFGKDISFYLGNNEMPVITGKKIFYNKAFHEAEWIFSGDENTAYLNDNGINWWNEYADNEGNISKTYGYQLRNYNGYFDQIEYVVKEINKGSRRAYVSFWNPTDQNDKIPCCYTGMNFVLTSNGMILNAEIQFRSSDAFLGLPYDFIVLALILKKIAYETNKKPGRIKYSLSNAHIYYNHFEAVQQYLRTKTYRLPFDNGTDTLDYKSGPYIEAKLNN